jgi:hypothetical protein
MHLLQHCERGIGEWHAVFLPRLHASGRDGPQLRVHIDLVPGRAQRLAGAGGGKDEKFEGAGGNAVLLSQRGEEGTDPDIRHRRVVLDLPYLALGR